MVNQEHEALWQRLFKESRVRAIATLPRGSFAPYTDAGTNVLYLTDKGECSTEWYYHATISGPKAKGATIEKDEFLFFYQDSDKATDDCPLGVEVVRLSDGRNRSWRVATPSDVVPLVEVASIVNGKMITEAQASPGQSR